MTVLTSGNGYGLAPHHRQPESLAVNARPEQKRAYERYRREYVREAERTQRRLREAMYARRAA